MEGVFRHLDRSGAPRSGGGRHPQEEGAEPWRREEQEAEKEEPEQKKQKVEPDFQCFGEGSTGSKPKPEKVAEPANIQF